MKRALGLLALLALAAVSFDRVTAVASPAQPQVAEGTTEDAAEAPIVLAQGIVIVDAMEPRGPIYFGAPLMEVPPELQGQTIEQLISASPLHPPIEGLPPEIWQEQTCANCHQWNQATLCDQAEFYTTLAGIANLDKPHPFGGAFKRNLKVWAEGGCQ
ncbi:MAG: hypothetical protein AAF667_11290 [Pseudomonadota bacterium]